jgi:hypothetical protein
MNWLVFHLLEWCASTSAATMIVFAQKENDEMSRGFFLRFKCGASRRQE